MTKFNLILVLFSQDMYAFYSKILDTALCTAVITGGNCGEV